MVVTEYWLKKSVPDSDVYLTGYNVFISDTVCRGVGVALYIQSNLNVVMDTETSVPKQFECLVLNVGPPDATGNVSPSLGLHMCSESRLVDDSI